MLSVTAAGAVAALAGCGERKERGQDGAVSSQGAPAADDVLERIKSDGKVRIGLEGTYKPYAYHDDKNQLVGFEKEIADAIAEKLGAEPEYVETEWDSLIAGLDVDKYDFVINNVGITPERQEKYLFTKPYARAIGRVAVPTDSGIKSFDDLKGVKAAQTATSNWAQRMEELGAEIQPVQGFAEAIELVVQGRAEATANDIVSFTYYKKEHPDADFRLLDGELPGDVEVGIILQKGQEDLQARLNEILHDLKSSGTLTSIYTEWVGEDLTPKS